MAVTERSVKRVPIGLTARDLADLQKIRQSPSAIPGLPENPSEAAVASAVFQLGMQLLRERQLEEGYEALAASIRDDEAEVAERQALRRRRAAQVSRP